MVVIQEEKLPLLNGKKMWKKMVERRERTGRRYRFVWI